MTLSALPKALVLGFFVLVASAPSEARQLKQVASLCAANMKEEFGAAAFKFNKLRRDEDNDRQRLFGELTLKNGKTARIRCRVRDGKVFDVRFSTGSSNSLGGQMWEQNRPEGAEYIPFENEENEDEASSEEGENETTEEQPEPADGEVETTQNEAEPADQTAENEEEPQRSRFIKAPGN